MPTATRSTCSRSSGVRCLGRGTSDRRGARGEIGRDRVAHSRQALSPRAQLAEGVELAVELRCLLGDGTGRDLDLVSGNGAIEEARGLCVVGRVQLRETV